MSNNIFNKTKDILDERASAIKEAWNVVSVRHIEMMRVEAKIAEIKAQIASDNDIIRRLNRGYLFELEDTFNIIGTIRELKDNITEILKSILFTLKYMAGSMTDQVAAEVADQIISFLEYFRDLITNNIRIRVPIIGDIIEILKVLSELGRLKKLIPQAAREKMEWSMLFGGFYDVMSLPEEWMEYYREIVIAAQELCAQLPIFLLVLLSMIVMVIINILKKVCDTLHLDFDFSFEAIFGIDWELNVDFNMLDWIKMEPPKNPIEALLLLIPLILRGGIPLFYDIIASIRGKLKELYGLYYFCSIAGTSKDQYLSAANLDILSCNAAVNYLDHYYDYLKAVDREEMLKDEIARLERSQAKYAK